MDIKQLHKVINDIIKSRKIIKDRNESEFIEKSAFKEELQEFHEPTVRKLEEVEQGRVNTMEGLQKAIESFSPTKSETPKRVTFRDESPILYDPDKGLDIEYLISKNWVIPSEIIKSPMAFDIIDETVDNVNTTLRSLGGRKSAVGRKQGRDSPNYNIIGEEISELKEYRDRLRLIRKGLESQFTGSGIMYNNMDELVKRLQLLIGSKQAGNTSTEVHNEIVQILDVLLNKNAISKEDHKQLSSLYLNA